MHYEYSYAMEEGLGTLLSLLSGLPVSGLNLAGYVLTALALYSLAKRRGISHAWLAWVPILNCWLIGSLSDQYRYLVRGEIRSKRKSLLVLNILNGVLITVLVILAIVLAVMASTMGLRSFYTPWQEPAGQIVGVTIAIVCVALVIPGVAIACAVIRFMALGDIFRSMDPENGTLFLVLSIFFPVTEPFFLFFNRNKDLGMPPRREMPPKEEPWEQETFDNF